MRLGCTQSLHRLAVVAWTLRKGLCGAARNIGLPGARSPLRSLLDIFTRRPPLFAAAPHRAKTPRRLYVSANKHPPTFGCTSNRLTFARNLAAGQRLIHPMLVLLTSLGHKRFGPRACHRVNQRQECYIATFARTPMGNLHRIRLCLCHCLCRPARNRGNFCATAPANSK